MHRKPRFDATGLSSRALLLALCLSASASFARADVTIQEKTVTTGLGGFGNGTSERTLVVAGDKSRSDDQFTYTGRFKTLAGGGKPKASAEIVRLDRELIWSLDLEKKQYGEMTFADMRAMMDKGMADAQAEMRKPENKHPDVEMDFKVDVQRTGKKDVVNGFKAENVIITLTATPKDKSKSSAGAAGYKITLDQWLSNDVQGQGEILAYYKKFAEKLGMDPQLQQMARGIMGQYGNGVHELADKLRDLKGYPVRSTMTMGLDMGLTPEQQAQMQKAQADARKASAENRAKQDKKDDDAATESAASNAARGDIKGALGGFLGHKFAKSVEKKAEASASSGSEDSSEPGFTFKATTDVLKVSTGASSASFEVPSDFKKVERKQR